VLASMTDFYRLHLNGVYMGVYLYLEDPEEPYLARQGRDEGGNLYKSYSTDEMRTRSASSISTPSIARRPIRKPTATT